MWALIGGSGFEKFDNFKTVEELDRNTPFGEASSGLKKVLLGDTEMLFLSRHGENHELLPSEVNYRANIYALRKYGATRILSVSAVGSLQAELKPGDCVVPTQYIDRTKSIRKTTFCGEGVVGHMSLAHPTSLELTQLAQELSASMDFDCHFGKTYVCIEGPNFSTVSESNSYRQMDADIIGMTNFPEYALAREAGLHYLPCSFVTDYDCWDQSRPHVTLEEVLEVMRNNNAKAFQLTQALVASDLPESAQKPTAEGLMTGLMTPWDAVPADKKPWLEVLRG